jgi:hypothetical protein
MKTIELQQKCLGGLGGNLNHYFANGVRITREQFRAIQNEATNNGEYLNSWESNQNGVVILGMYVKVRDEFNY